MVFRENKWYFDFKEKEDEKNKQNPDSKYEEWLERKKDFSGLSSLHDFIKRKIYYVTSGTKFPEFYLAYIDIEDEEINFEESYRHYSIYFGYNGDSEKLDENDDYLIAAFYCGKLPREMDLEIVAGYYDKENGKMTYIGKDCVCLSYVLYRFYDTYDNRLCY